MTVAPARKPRPLARPPLGMAIGRVSGVAAIAFAALWIGGER